MMPAFAERSSDLGPAALALATVAGRVRGTQEHPVITVGEWRVHRVLDPVYAAGPTTDVLLACVFQTLVRYSEAQEPVPDLACSWSVTADGLVYSFQLNREALFHNGETVTSLDVATSLARHLWPESRSPFKQLLSSLLAPASIPVRSGAVPPTLRTPSAHCVELVLPFRYPPLLQLLASPHLGIVQVLPSGACAGSGPLMPLDPPYREEQRFAVYPRYRGSRPRANPMALRLFASEAEVAEALAAGTVDAALTLPPAEFLTSHARGQVRETVQSGRRVFHFFLNGRWPWAANAAFRRDLGRLVQTAAASLPGHSHLEPCPTLLPSGAMAAAYYQRPAVPLTAQAFAAVWGEQIAGEPLRMPVASARDEAAVVEVGRWLAACGFAVTHPRSANYDAFAGTLACGDFELLLDGYSEHFPDPDGLLAFLPVLERAAGPLFDRAEFEAAVAACRAVAGDADRQAAYAAVLRTLEDQWLVLPFVQTRNRVYHRASLMISKNAAYPFDHDEVHARVMLEYQERLRLGEQHAAIALSMQMLAHDVRKPLSMVSIGLDMLVNAKTSLARTESIVTLMVPEVRKAIASVEGMIGDVLEISESVPPVRQPVAVEALIAGALRETFAMRPDPALMLSYDLQGDGMLDVDAKKVRRALANILRNAADACRVGGRVWFRTKPVLIRKGAPGLLLVVGNDGPLIPPADLQYLFEPFFTKGKRQGTGLGLAIARKVVAAHGGRITCISQERVGTEFHLWLPVADQAQDRTGGQGVELAHSTLEISALSSIRPVGRTAQRATTQMAPS